MNLSLPKAIRLIENYTAIEIIDRQQREFGTAFYFVALGIISVIMGLVVSGDNTFILILTGILFFAGGGVAIYTVDERQTILRQTGQSEVITKRRLNHKTFRQTFDQEDIEKIEFYHMFTEGTWGNGGRSDAIYLVLKNGEKIRILYRHGTTFFFKQNQPLTAEVNYISSFLNIPSDTKEMTTLAKSMKNFGSAVDASMHDRARVGFPDYSSREDNSDKK